MPDTSLQSISTVPEWFLASINPETGTVSFVRTSENIIRDASFLDGRVPISHGNQTITIEIDDALAWQNPAPVQKTDRVLAHISFCGSTLLGRLLQGNGSALCYSEPHILVELATLKAKGHALSQDKARWQGVIAYTLGQLRKSWGDIPALSKPSNWANTLLSDIIDASPDLRWAIIDTSLEDFLIANLRGGKSRLAYSLNLLNHFLSAKSTFRAHVLEVERGGLEPVQRLLRLLMIVFETQERLLDDAVLASRARVARVSKAELQTAPEATIRTVSQHLHMNLSPADIDAAIAREMGQHAKDTRRAYHPEAEAAESARLRQELAPAFDAALGWRTETLQRVA